MSASLLSINPGVTINAGVTLNGYHATSGASFTINLSDIVSATNYYGDTNLVVNSNGFTTVQGLSNSQIAAPYQANLNNTPYTAATTAFTNAGYTTSDSYVWNVTWASYTPTIGSLAYNGNSYLSVPNSSGFDQNTGSVTVECWAYPNATGTFWIYGQNTPGFFGIYWASYNNTFSINQNSYSDAVNGVTSCPPGAWYHVAMCLDTNAGNINLYVNGVDQGPQTTPGNYTSSQDVTAIGAQDGTGSYQWTDGYITNFRVTKSSGSPVYTGNFTPPTSTLQNTQNAGTNISAITTGQVQLLLNANFQLTNLIDTSQYAITVTNTYGVTWNAATPLTAPTTIPNYSDVARVYVGSSNQIWIVPIDTTYSNWQSNITNSYNVPCEIGTYTFPATFTQYTPTKDAGNTWC